MIELNSNGLGWYRFLLKLYPKSYRLEYEEEMLTTLQEMFSSAKSSTEKRQILFRTFKDFFLSLTQQNILATENSFSEAPSYVKRDISISTCLVAPFFLIFTYNITSLYFHHTVIILGSLEAKTWVIYSIILPLFGLMLSVKTCLSGVYGQLQQYQWRRAISTVFRDWLFLGVLVATLALVAIF